MIKIEDRDLAEFSDLLTIGAEVNMNKSEVAMREFCAIVISDMGKQIKAKANYSSSFPGTAADIRIIKVHAGGRRYYSYGENNLHVEIDFISRKSAFYNSPIARFASSHITTVSVGYSNEALLRLFSNKACADMVKQLCMTSEPISFKVDEDMSHYDCLAVEEWSNLPRNLIFIPESKQEKADLSSYSELADKILEELKF